MTTAIVSYDVRDLIDRWMEAEKNGESFPVDFDMAWEIAGYSRKSVAKRRLIELEKDTDYCTEKCKTLRGGRSSDSFYMTCDAFKHFCLMAKTDEGRQIRQYFIEAEKKWKMVQQQHPSIAQEVELQLLKNEGLRLEAQVKQADYALISFRNTIVQTCPEPVQQKILGYQTVEKIEYRDRVIVGDRLINDGNTATKTELCHRYKLLTKTGKPNYRQLNAMLEAVGMDTNSNAWDMSATIQENYQFKREYLPELDRRIINGDRQLNLGE